MIRAILNGCSGRMGRVITELIANEEGMQIAAGIDVAHSSGNSFPVFSSPSECKVPADVLIDFSSPACFDALMDYCVQRQLPAVICTTGLTAEQIKRLKAESENVALLRSANMSLGVNLLMKVLKEISPTLANAGFDMEIVEMHHNRKKDAPSGTALALADSIREGLSKEYEYTFDRSGRFEPRREQEIGISSVRAGTIVGEHEVIFAGTDEVITFRHTAYSRALFAKGALAAAKYLSGKGPGLYSMSDVIEG